jgi:hypothetical protein
LEDRLVSKVCSFFVYALPKLDQLTRIAIPAIPSDAAQHGLDLCNCAPKDRADAATQRPPGAGIDGLGDRLFL